MVIVAALLVAAAPAEPAPPAQRVAAQSQAIAMVRILPGAQIRFSEIEQSASERLRDTEIRSADGSSEPARLVEFQ
jgi:hypothetical protein